MVAALGERPLTAEQRAWLEAAAAAAAVTALMRDTQAGDLEGSRRALLQALAASPPGDVSALVTQARRLGVELASGAIAVCAQGPENVAQLELPAAIAAALLADIGGGRVIGLLPLAAGFEAVAAELASELARRRDGGGAVSPAARTRALARGAARGRAAAGAGRPEVQLAGQEETYRLLIGVLLRGREELESLRAEHDLDRGGLRPRARHRAAGDAAVVSRPPRLDHRDGRGDAPAPSHGRIPADPGAGGLRALSRTRPTGASGSASASRPTRSSRPTAGAANASRLPPPRSANREELDR